MDNAEVQKMVTALGEMAEALGVFRHGLLESGFNERDALLLCVEYLKSAIGKNGV